MEFIKLNGYISEDSSFISFDIKGGKNRDSIGDQIWISEDGKKMEVYQHSDQDVLEDAMNLFVRNHQLAFKGAMRRMGVTF